MSGDVLIERHGTVRHLVLNSPERLNALSRSMLDEMRVAIAEIADDREASVLVVSGAGRAFCAGADLVDLFGETSRPTAELRDELKTVYAGFLGLMDLPIPTISAVHGVAVGAGVNIALSCDVVLAGPRARFAVTFAEIGLHPGGGCSWFLAQRIGASRALSVILSGETVQGGEALRIGLATECVDDPVAEALARAEHWATRDPGLLRDMKRAVQLARGGELRDVLEFESWAQASAVGKPRFNTYLERFRS
ncbi:MAG: enoyl-CoA hydratase [Nocardioides sp.]|uniref:enoyl-CoA hydratase n=1 Tax=Nocardioides sp. TaxID=35761 RepID=UPI0039E59B7F